MRAFDAFVGNSRAFGIRVQLMRGRSRAPRDVECAQEWDIESLKHKQSKVAKTTQAHASRNSKLPVAAVQTQCNTDRQCTLAATSEDREALVLAENVATLDAPDILEADLSALATSHVCNSIKRAAIVL